METASLSQRFLDFIDGIVEVMVRQLGSRAYYFLAALLSVVVIIDFAFFHQVVLMESRIFDLLVSHRVRYVTADPEIVIVDIDEASLSSLSKDYGRWPWPRQVIGEWVEGIEQQKPKAIVFDILFSDPDIFNPDSEAYFNAAIAATDNTFFPMLRLGKQNDHLSQVKPSMLPWLTPAPGETQQDEPLAVILPRYQAAIESGRIGSHQVTPDKDSVIRHYPIFHEHAGWQIPSLPHRLGEQLKFPPSQPDQRSFLINWRGKAFSYRFVSFGDVYTDFLKKNRLRPPDEFAGKIVILGSTAPSLFDIKASPTAKIFPGVEILATAIDNLKNDDALRELQPSIKLAMALVFIWGMAAALTRQIPVALFDRMFAGLQVFFIGAAYLTLNFANVYIDMSAPMTFGLVYFSIARAYSSLSGQWLTDHRLVSRFIEKEGEFLLRVLVVATTASTGKEKRRVLACVNRLVGESTAGARRIGNLVEDAGRVQDMFSGILLVYWLIDAEDALRLPATESDLTRVRQEIETSLAALQPRFALRVGRIELTANGNWKTAGKRIIIEALEQIVEQEESLRPEPSVPENNQPS